MKKLNVVFFGTPEYVTPILEALHQNFNLVGVVTAPDAPIGRKAILTPSPVKERVKGIVSRVQIITPEQFNNSTIQQLKDLQPDLFVIAAYGKIIPQAVLDIPKHGSINIHPSNLPRFRGPSPIQAAILSGEEESGITFILLDEKMDHGPILFHEGFRFSQQDNFDTLSRGMFQKAAKSIGNVVTEYINGSIKPIPQDDDQATICKMIKKEDGYFSIDNPPSPEQLDRMIRAYYPWPTTWTRWCIKSHKSSVKDHKCEERVVKFLPNQMIQMEGKNPVSLKDFLNGHPTFPLKK